eukprot:4651258-Prymnesium_polylepis.1
MPWIPWNVPRSDEPHAEARFLCETRVRNRKRTLRGPLACALARACARMAFTCTRITLCAQSVHTRTRHSERHTRTAFIFDKVNAVHVERPTVPLSEPLCLVDSSFPKALASSRMRFFPKDGGTFLK